MPCQPCPIGKFYFFLLDFEHEAQQLERRVLVQLQAFLLDFYFVTPPSICMLNMAALKFPLIKYLFLPWDTCHVDSPLQVTKSQYSMPQTVWNTENVSKWTSNVQLLCSTASTYWIIYSWLTSNPKISIWVHTRAKIHSFSKCQNSDHF